MSPLVFVLDTGSQKAILAAYSAVINVGVEHLLLVRYTSTTVTVQATLLVGTSNAETIYYVAVNQLQASIASGTFAANLASASQTYGAVSTATTSVPPTQIVSYTTMLYETSAAPTLATTAVPFRSFQFTVKPTISSIPTVNPTVKPTVKPSSTPTIVYTSTPSSNNNLWIIILVVVMGTVGLLVCAVFVVNVRKKSDKVAVSV